MNVELLGAAMETPFYGNSLYVWTSVIGITLAGLAAGYFLGGLVSKKFPQTNTLFYLLLLAAMLVVVMPFWGNLVMIRTLDWGYMAGGIISCTLFLFPPLVCFGMTSPVIIKLITDKISNAGNIAGNVYAVSTAGGIITTFLTGFYILPIYGLKVCIIANVIVLTIISLSYFIINRKFLVTLGIIFFVFITAAAWLNPQKQKRHSHIKILHRSDGLLGQVMIADDKKTQKRSLHINNISQTFMHIPTGRSQWKYIHRITFYSSFKPAGSKVLICGLGGGNLVNELNILGFDIDAVEIDRRMKYLAWKHFYMTHNVKVYTDDARHYIRTCKKKYDIIILDMSAGENQPANIYTVACFKELQSILNDDGIVFLHYQNVLEGKHDLAVKSIGSTLQTSGFHHKLINTQSDWKLISELMFFASMKPAGKGGIDLTSYSFERRDRFSDPFNFPTGQDIFIDDYDFSDGIILTDDNPIMDVLHVNALEMTRGGSINTTIPILLKEKIEVF